MSLSEYVEYDATGLASLVSAGEVTPMELKQLARAAHDQVNPINAVIEFYEMLTLSRARILVSFCGLLGQLWHRHQL
ncbi:hypothetical protein [Mesorhizobium sp.]|uniref:hypothetical protein n=1 Tax=Mesorhizobium sp. TaxID=1871066 RepID=UPI0025799FD6|nr:hypothetical protein [Mesorhizobium sp.]